MDRPVPPACLAPEEMLCFDVYALAQAFGRMYKPLLAPLRLTYPQYLAMSVLWDDSPATVGRIAHRLGLETSTVTPIVKRLEVMGYVRRERDVADERRVLVHLTDEGGALAREAAHIPGCVEHATGLDAEEIAALRRRLQQLGAALTQA